MYNTENLARNKATIFNAQHANIKINDVDLRPVARVAERGLRMKNMWFRRHRTYN